MPAERYTFATTSSAHRGHLHAAAPRYRALPYYSPRSTRSSEHRMMTPTVPPQYKEYAIDDPDLLQNRPVAQRALVISAGVIFNMILSFGAILAVVTSGGVMEPTLKPGVAVPQIVNAEGAGARFGVMTGDIVVKVDGQIISSQERETADLVQRIKKSGGKPLRFEVLRGQERVQLVVTPDRLKNGDGVIGVKLAANVDKVSSLRQEAEGRKDSLRRAQRQ